MALCRDIAVVLGTILVLLPAVVFGKHNGANRAEIQSDRLVVDHDKKSAEFSGHVRVVYQNLRITCDKLDVGYTEQGGVKSLRAAGRVTVQKDGARAEAKTAHLDTGENLLILEGDPLLIRGKNRLTGSRIVVHLGLLRIDVEEARGTFLLGE